jgi:predicted O-methyltransferase YrrM
LYEQALTPAEQEALQELKSASFKTDVAVIRILQVRLLRMAASVQTVGEMIELLQAYGMSLYRMAKVLETEQRQGKDQDPMADVLSRSLSRALKELENG